MTQSFVASSTCGFLEEASPHLSLPLKVSLLTNVLLPVVSSHCELRSSLTDLNLKFDVAVFEAVLRIIRQLIDACGICREIFVRHHGLQCINQILSSYRSFMESTVVACALDILTIFMVKETTLSQSTVINVYGASAEKKALSKQKSLDFDSQGVRGFFRSLSITSWNSERRKSAFSHDMKPEKSRVGKLSAKIVHVDEEIRMLREMQGFVNLTMDQIAAAGRNDRAVKDRSWHTLASYSKSNQSGCDSSDSEADGSEQQYRRKVSDTSGYRSNKSTGADSPDERHSSISSRSFLSPVQYIAEHVLLPEKSSGSAWSLMADLWYAMSITLPYNQHLCDVFVEANGIDVTIKLLHLLIPTISSAIFHAESDFTFATADNVSLATQDESASVARVSVHEDQSTDLPPSGQVAAAIDADSSRGIFLSDDTTSLNKSSQFRGSAPSLSEGNLLENKLKVFASCLRIVLYSANELPLVSIQC